MMGENTGEWYDIAGKLKAKAQEFKQAFAQLQNAHSRVKDNPELMREGNALIKTGNAIRNKVLTVTSSIDNAFSWLKSSVGLSGLNGDNTLGILPLIPLSVAAASVAAMTKFISDTYIYIDKVNKFDVLEKKYGAERAAAIVSKLAPNNFMSLIVSNIIPIAVIGGGLLYLLKRR